MLNAFFNLNLIIGINSNARKVRNTENLAARGKVFQMASDRDGDFPADSRIDFVEYERRHRIDAGKYRFERKHNA